MAVRRTPMQSYTATVAKFKAVNATMDQAAQIIRGELYDDLRKFTTGATPSGPERLKWLRRMGHPYGRGARASLSTSTGRKRGAGVKGTAPTLPIGEITGALAKSRFVILRPTGHSYVFHVGFNRRAGNALFAVLPFGTSKMVGRGLWAPIEQGALGKRVKLYRKAFRDTFQRANKQP